MSGFPRKRGLRALAASVIAVAAMAVAIPTASAAPLSVAPSNGRWGGTYADPVHPDPVLLFDDAIRFQLRNRVVSKLSVSTHLQCRVIDTGQLHEVAFDYRNGFPTNRPGAGFPSGQRIPASGVLRVNFAAFSLDGFWGGTMHMIIDFSRATPQARFSYLGEDANPDGTEPAVHNEECSAQRKHVNLQKLVTTG